MKDFTDIITRVSRLLNRLPQYWAGDKGIMTRDVVSVGSKATPLLQKEHVVVPSGVAPSLEDAVDGLQASIYDCEQALAFFLDRAARAGVPV